MVQFFLGKICDTRFLPEYWRITFGTESRYPVEAGEYLVRRQSTHL